MTESSARWLSFRAPMPDIATMLRSCARVAETALEYTQHRPPLWWPTVLAPGQKKAIRSTSTTGANSGRGGQISREAFHGGRPEARTGVRVGARLIQEHLAIAVLGRGILVESKE